MLRPSRKPSPPVCPVCSQPVPPNSAACPECGACHESGWKEDAEVYDGLDFLDEATESEDGRVRWSKGSGMHPFWRVVALIAVLALFWWFWKSVFPAGR
jgi:hypothetical protein